MKRILSILLALTVLLSAAAVLPVSAKGGKELPGAAMTPADRYDVVAVDGIITPKYGKLENGKAKAGDVMTVALDATAHPDATFKYWKSIYGDIVDEATFEVYVDRDVYFYPVYSDLNPSFGPWTLLKLRSCEIGDIYVRTDAALGYSQYKLKFHNWGNHDELQFVCVDENTCRRICERCGWYEDGEHDLSYHVVKEPTADEPGLAEYTCNNGCGYSYTEEIEPGSAGEHEHRWIDTYDDIITEAKDGQPGVRRLHCALCDATKDVWYIKAEWEKYYFGNHLFFDSSDSSGLWGTDDEHHYSFVNDEGYNTYVYAVRQDYRDDNQCWEFMWIDHADELGRKPLYVAKSRGKTEYNTYDAYSWAVIDYDIHTVDEYISWIDFITSGYDRYSSSFFDNVKRYEILYNQQMFPADGPSDFIGNMNGTWVYEDDSSLRVHDRTGIEYYDIMFNDRREFLHIDPKTNCVLLRYEPNASSRWCEIKKIQPIVSPEEKAAILAAFPPVDITPAPVPAEGNTDPNHVHTMDGNAYSYTYVNEQYHKHTCTDCGYEEYYEHEPYLSQPHYNTADPHASTATWHCSCSYEEERPYLLSTDEIQNDLYQAFREKSTLSISLNNDVLHTPSPVNFQLRVDPLYLVGGPDDSTYATGHGGFNRYYCTGYAASYGFTYGGAQNDIFAFGVIRAGEGYRQYAPVELKLPEAANYVFKRWEIYDWATGSWQLFSSDPTPTFNDVNDDGDTRVHDLTILRAVREYVEPERYTVKVVGGTFYAETEDWTEQRAEGAVDANAKIYINYDNAAVPAGKEFDHYDVYNKEGDLIGTTDGWEYTVDQDGLVFRAAYADKLYWVGFDGENGNIYLISDGSAGSGKDKDKDDPKAGDDPKDSEKTVYYGGEYHAGTVITVTTESMDEEAYPYFIGWYYVTYDEGVEERELLTADRELTVTVTIPDDKSGCGSYRAVWSDTQNPVSAEDTDYRVLHVSSGFASVRRMREGLFLSTVRVPYYSSVSFMVDPGAFIDVEKWRLTGVFADESAFAEEITADSAEYWFEGEDCAPKVVWATPVGATNLVFADGDGDGDVTINDATRVQRVLAGYSDDLYGRTGTACDVTGNMRLDILDATTIQRYLASYDVPNQDRFGQPMDANG